MGLALEVLQLVEKTRGLRGFKEGSAAAKCAAGAAAGAAASWCSRLPQATSSHHTINVPLLGVHLIHAGSSQLAAGLYSP